MECGSSWPSHLRPAYGTSMSRGLESAAMRMRGAGVPAFMGRGLGGGRAGCASLASLRHYPPQPTTLCAPSRNLLGHLVPIFPAVALHLRHEQLVLLPARMQPAIRDQPYGSSRFRESCETSIAREIWPYLCQRGTNEDAMETKG